MKTTPEIRARLREVFAPIDASSYDRQVLDLLDDIDELEGDGGPMFSHEILARLGKLGPNAVSCNHTGNPDPAKRIASVTVHCDNLEDAHTIQDALLELARLSKTFDPGPVLPGTTAEEADDGGAALDPPDLAVVDNKHDPSAWDRLRELGRPPGITHAGKPRPTFAEALVQEVGHTAWLITGDEDIAAAVSAIVRARIELQPADCVMRMSASVRTSMRATAFMVPEPGRDAIRRLLDDVSALVLCCSMLGVPLTVAPE